MVRYDIIERDAALTYEEFFALECECFPAEPFNRLQYADLVMNIYWTVRVEGQLAGFVNAVPHPDRVHLNRIEVREPFRNAGIGGALVDLVLSYAAQQGAPCVTLAVRTNNAPAYRLYVQKGFSVAGHKYRYAIPAALVPDSTAVLFVTSREGRQYPVFFIRKWEEVGSGVYHPEVGGCKDVVLKNPSEDLLDVLAAIKANLKPGSTHLYAMTNHSETVKALKALPFTVETEFAEMKCMLGKEETTNAHA